MLGAAVRPAGRGHRSGRGSSRGPARGYPMSPSARLAALPCGRRAKWVVLAFWLVLLIVAVPLAGKLTDAEDNEASSWLPGNAESTQVLNEQRAFFPVDIARAVV